MRPGKTKSLVAERVELVEDREGPRGQRHAVLAAALHARRRDRPDGLLEVDLGPARADDLARAGGGQDGELQRQRSDRLPRLAEPLMKAGTSA